MKAWLKAGLIGAILIFLYNAVFLYAVEQGLVLPILFFVEYPTILFSYIFGFGSILQGWQAYLVTFLALPFFYFFLGALIGFIIDKIKPRS